MWVGNSKQRIFYAWPNLVPFTEKFSSLQKITITWYAIHNPLPPFQLRINYKSLGMLALGAQYQPSKLLFDMPYNMDLSM
jgi:hypothetical protein